MRLFSSEASRASTDEQLSRFANEAGALAKLDHSNIVRHVTHFCDGERGSS